MNSKIIFLCLVTLILLTGCGLKTIPIVKDTSVISEASGGKFNCKCKYNETNAHSGDEPYLRNRLQAMAKEAHIYANMSFNAYAREPQIYISGWKKVERFESSKGFAADVYSSTNPNNHEMIIAFKGTDGIFALNDQVFANFYINWFSGGQFSQADEVFNHVVYKYHPSKITTTGHSLGGGLAIRISLLNKGIDAYVFSSSIRTGTGIGSRNTWGNNIISIRDSGELLSFFRHSTLFKEIKKNDGDYRYNFLGGSASDEHNMQKFAQCMYIAGVYNSKYESGCKK